jgi:hypothetical protein
MTQSEFAKMLPPARAKWLNKVSPTSKWKLGDDVFCLHCDGLPIGFRQEPHPGGNQTL